MTVHLCMYADSVPRQRRVECVARSSDGHVPFGRDGGTLAVHYVCAALCGIGTREGVHSGQTDLALVLSLQYVETVRQEWETWQDMEVD